MKIKIGLMLLLATFKNFAVGMEYPALKAQEQQEYLWQKIAERPYEALPKMTGPSPWQAFTLLRPSFNKQVFIGDHCTMPADRDKIIHAFGSVVEVAYEVTNREFSGIFDSGALGLLRLSVAKPSEEHAYLPGFGLMLFIDNKPPLSVLAMPSLDPQTVPHLLTYDFTTSIPTPKTTFQGWLLGRQFNQGIAELGFKDHDSRLLSNDHLAAVTSDGQAVKAVDAPYELIFKPTIEAKNLLNGITSRDDFRSILSKNGNGRALFNVYAKRFHNSEPEPIGRIIATSDFVASKFGDELRFKHPAPMKKLKKRSSCWFW